jgi:3-dehydroshikimate dehydratase
MLKTGLVSVTFRKLMVEQIVGLASQAGIQSIEWGGDIHIPPGDFATAERALKLTQGANLNVSSYGSYYKSAESEKNGISFNIVLQTAEILGAPLIRVWAGIGNAEDVNETYWQKVINDTRRIADLAGEKNIKVAFEFHSGTLNNTPQSSRILLEMIKHENVGTYWQPIHGAGVEKNCTGIEQIYDWIAGVHVFHWWPGPESRHLLRDGIEQWERYIEKLPKKEICFSIEFVKDDKPENFLLDAQTLKELIK